MSSFKSEFEVVDKNTHYEIHNTAKKPFRGYDPHKDWQGNYHKFTSHKAATAFLNATKSRPGMYPENG